MASYTPSELSSFEMAILISSGLSLVGASTMATCIIFPKPWLQNSRADEKILFSMCLVSIVGALAMIQNHQVVENNLLCQVQATILQYAVQSLPIFNLCQSFNFWYILTEGKTPGKFSWIYLSCGFIIPLISAIGALLGGLYSNAVIWCWISKKHSDFRYALFYAPLWISIAFGIIFTYLGVRKVYSIEKQGMITNYKHTRTASKAFLYGLVFVITWTPGTINRVYEAIHGHSPWILVLSHCIFTPLQGFLNAVVFFYLRSTKQEKNNSSGIHTDSHFTN